jgi:hypothetical protein
MTVKESLLKVVTPANAGVQILIRDELKCYSNKEMSEFLIFIFEDASFQITASILFFTFTLILLYHKLFRYALILGLVFLVILAIVLKGPFGQELIKKFRGKSTQSLFMYNQKDKIGAERQLVE